MEFSDIFPVWEQLTETQRQTILASIRRQHAAKGTVLHNGSADCTGLLLIESGQLRAYILSDEGREITLYRLFDRDICLLSASCILRSIQFDITVEAEKDTAFWLIPSDIYQELMSASAPVANFTGEVMAARFSEVMWLIEQIMWKSFDKRLAAFLLEEANLDGTDHLRITHEIIGNHLGTAREVVTRMLRYFQSEGMVRLARGTVTIVDRAKLQAVCKA
nr:Crp/Fnr family transcriptional regulator [uncultured Agathobaculum sp.]